MTDLTPNIPDVVAEISALFEAYEQALIDKNVDVLDAAFWNSPHTVSYTHLDVYKRQASHRPKRALNPHHRHGAETVMRPFMLGWKRQ